MNDSAKPSTSTRASRLGDGFDIGKMLLEGRAFFALIVIIIVFSMLSPYYFAVENFLTMASHVAIYGILAIGMLLVIINVAGIARVMRTSRSGQTAWIVN